MTSETKPLPQPAFLPVSRDDMARLGWDSLDVLLVTGDAYVDHPSFGAPLLGRWLVAHGFRVGIIAQPNWKSLADISRLGRPRLFAGVTAGALDSMLAHYTAFKKPRRDDAYTPGGEHGSRPNRATLVYTSLVRQAFPGLPVVIGGIEASLRRATHYDFWSNSLRRSILIDSQADLLAYGMSERSILQIAQRLDARLPLPGNASASSPPPPPNPVVAGPAVQWPIGNCQLAIANCSVTHPLDLLIPRSLDPFLCGCCWSITRDADKLPLPDLAPEIPPDANVVRLPSHEDISSDPKNLMTATLALERQVHDARSFAFQTVASRTVFFAPPAEPLSTAELDLLYSLPFSRLPHPSYKQPIPAVEMIQFSVTSHRGCGGGCSFCSLALHQGRRIASRSRSSILAEVKRLTTNPKWTGALSDVGGPSANMWNATCIADASSCKRASCLAPNICPNFQADQQSIVDLLREISRLPKVKSVRVASGVRHDLALAEPDYVRALVGDFTGGQLKLAPEHSCDHVLKLMRKPAFKAFEQFLTVFERNSRGAGKEQFIIPYLISAFPGCTDADMRKLSSWLKSRHWTPRQVQCFIPTPGTVATAMFYAGIDPDGHPISVPKTDSDRLRQHRILRPTLGRPD